MNECSIKPICSSSKCMFKNNIVSKTKTIKSLIIQILYLYNTIAGNDTVD